MGKSIKAVAKIVTAPIKAMYDPVGAFKDVFGGVQEIFAGLTGTGKVASAPGSEPSSQTVRSSKAPVRFILGRISTGGVLAWVQEQPGGQTTGEWLHIVYVLSEGAIAGVDEIFVDEQPIASLGGFATYEVIVNPTAPNEFLRKNCPDWRAEQIGRNLSFVRVSFLYNAEKFPSGIPDVRFVVRGRNDIYDPRDGQSRYSANTALLILWYLRNRCGIPDDEIIFETFASAANISDEMVTDPQGKRTARYFAGAVVGADEKRNSVLENLLEACAGTLIRVGGRWSLQVGAYYGPADFVITEDMVIGTVDGTTEVSNSDAINTVRGTFIDPSQAWADTDYPEVVVQEWIAQDGGELAESQSYSYVTDAYLAQRLANIALRRRRSGGTLSMPLNFGGYNCRPGRAVTVNLPSLNILGEFIVTDWGMGAMDACKVTLKPYEQAIFDDAVGQPYNPLGFINLPVGGLAAVTNLAWTPATASEVIQGILSWAPPAQTVLSYTVVIRQGGVVVQALKVGGEANTCNVNGLNSGVYALSVICYGPGTVSGEATINVSVDVPPMPESCLVTATVNTITLAPRNSKGLNGGTYEYFFVSREGAPVTEAVYLGQGMSFTHTGLAFAKSYFYYVRSANAYGKSAFLFVKAATSDDAREILDVIKGEILESDLGKQLTGKIEKIALIDGNGPGSVNERLGTAKTELAKQISDVNNALSTTKSDLQQQITAVSADVSAAKTDLQQQIANVSALAGSLPYRKDKTYSISQSALGADGKLYQATKAVPLNTPPPNADYWTDVGQAVVTANGVAARVSKVETDVSTLDGKAAAQASQLSGLQTSLTTTNGNVTAAQSAADAANALAGGKGKVIIQAAAPATADRLAQNLWIDTTSNANTPKRWSGSAWVAVTDKAATDAAAAAQSALALAQTKADASVVSSLTTRVSDAEGKLTSQASKLDGMQTSIDGKASSQALQQVTSRVTATEQKDAAQDQQLTSQSQALTSLKDSVDKKADSSAVQSLSNEVKQQGQTLTSQGQSLVAINSTIGQLGGENWIYNPSFEKAGSGGLADGWARAGASGVTANPSIVPSALATGEFAQRIDVTGVSASAWGRIGNVANRRVKVSPDTAVTLSAYVRGTPGLSVRCEIQFLNAVGSSISGVPVAANTLATADYARLSHSVVAPQGTVECNFFVTCYGTAAISSAFLEVDRCQLEFSPSASGWRDNGAVNADAATAVASAVQSLSGRVDQTESSLTSQSGAITQLTNSLNTTNQEVGKKADASTLQSLGNTVSQQGTAISANGRALTSISASLANLGASGVNLVPAEYCAFAKDLPANMYSNGGVAMSTVADAAAFKGYALKAANSNVDSHTFGLNNGFTAAGCNMGFKPGKYLVSFYARAEVAGHVVGVYARVLLADGSSFKTSNAPTFTLTTAWARYVGVIDLTDPAYTGTQMQLAVQSNRSGVANRVTYYDRFMFEAAVNDQVEPSTFSMGNSFDQSAVLAEATTALSGRVGKNEEGLTSTSSQLTQLKNSIGGSGVNLLPAEYSTFQKTLPAIDGSSYVASLDSDAATFSGAALKFTWSSDSVALAAFLAASRNVGNMGMKPQKFIISYRARASVAGHVVALYLRSINADGSASNSPAATQQALTAAWARYSYVADLSGGGFTGDKMLLALQMNRSGVSGRSVWFDQIMVEQVVGDGTAPSTFVPGNTADQASAASSAVDSLSSAVTQQGKDLTSVAGRTTMLENSVNSTSSGLATKASTSALQTLTGRVTATESGLTAANSSITRIGSQVGAIGGTGSNLVPAEYSTFTGTLPAFRAQGGLGITPQADSSAYSGSLLKVDSSTSSGWLWLAGSASDFNLRLVAGRQYIVSFWAKGSAAHVVAVRLRYQNTAGGETEVAVANVNVATDMARLSLTFTAPAALSGPACIVLFTQSAGNAGITWFDGFMAEEKIGEATAPSAFTPGTSTRQAAGQALAVSALDTKVTQQGTRIESEAKRTDGLYTSVGNANAAIQDEATTRTNADSALSTRITTAQAKANEAAAAVQSEITTRANADSALGKRVDGVQSNLGDTNAAVERTSTALTYLNNVASASEVVKVQITANGIRYVGGFGIGIENNGGAVQSTFVVLADRFSILSPAGDSATAPFATIGNQTFVSEAYIRDASIGNAKIADVAITNAKIADAAITAAKIGQAEVDTLRIRGNAVTVPVGAFAGSNTVTITVTLEGNYPVYLQGSITQAYLSNITMTRNGVLLWREIPRESTLASRGVMDYPGAGTHTYTLSSDNGNNTNGASIFALVCKR
ncbi:DUF1983 domain-containing protein [Pseudomonas sp.]|uniref:phage tail tip fiber protein n=1 Tax=Pseudomonas sp. TaxID=306 RepID=UPI0028AD12E0|nr:DUF1983 domain-containing protein [Pseudomonas sp.]